MSAPEARPAPDGMGEEAREGSAPADRLSAEERARVVAVVDRLGPLSDDQRAALAMLLRAV